MNDAQPAKRRQSLLSFDIHTRDQPDWPVVSVLVDGADPFRSVAPGWLGFDPDDILGPTSPLLPTADGRRVAVCRCSCGEAGCGVIAPSIEGSSDGRRVLWRDFRGYVGAFFGPLPTDPGEQLIASRAWDVPDVCFDAEQYVAAIVRASADRTWETPRRQTARLLFEQLAPLGLSLPPDLPLRRAEPAWERDGVVLQFGRVFADATLSQHELRLSSEQSDPADAAEDMANVLLSTLPNEWPDRFGADD